MDHKFKLLVDSFGADRFKFDQPLKDYTTLLSEGNAKLFFIAYKTSEIVKVIKICRELNIPYFIFGTGSKIMISKSGFDGLVIKNRTSDIQTVSVKGKVTKFGIGIEEALIEVESGLSINKFCQYLDSHDLESQEFSNMPGTIGGNLFLNRFLQSKAKSIKILDWVSEIEKIPIEELNLKKHIILSAVFRIKSKK